MAKAPTQEMDFFEKIGYAFNLWNESLEALKLNIWIFVILYLLPIAVTVLYAMLFMVQFINQSVGNDVSAVGFIFTFIVSILVVLLFVVLYPVVTLTQLESAKGNKVSLSDVFNRGFKYLPAFIVLALVVIGAIGLPLIISILLVPFVIGILLFPLAIVWAVVASVFVMLVPYVIINDNLGAIESIKKAIDIVKVKWQWVLAVYAVFMIASLAGSVPFIGGIVSLAISIVYFCMPAIVYLRHIADQPVTEKSAEKAVKPAAKKQVSKKKPVKK